ncbi:Peptidase family M48 family protein [Perilla frutescens var. hirtella]|nr:Peptidase family M48 family protein [Perilla frutescens var. hirtella]KAH6811364.1 Peptidase family M48 family protein [Perilla frutescens var. frutescens]
MSSVYQNPNISAMVNISGSKYSNINPIKEANHSHIYNNNNKDDALNANNVTDKRFKTLPAAETLPRNEVLGGYIFVCNNDTMQEDLKRQLFGLPPRYRDSVRAITPGLPLFLYNYTAHQLHGIFEATTFGGSNIDPTAWEDKKCKGESRFPAQVRIRVRKVCKPLEEDAFRPVLHHYDGPKFRLELSVTETLDLLDLCEQAGMFSTERKLGEAYLVEAGIVGSIIGFVCGQINLVLFCEDANFCSNATNKPLISFSAGVKLKLPKSEQRSSNIVCRASSSVAVRDLDADDFRHPLDRQNTLLLRAIPGLNEIGKALLGTATEQVMLLENIGTSVLVSKNQLPELHELMVEAASILNIEAPDLYLRQSPVPNAYTLAISGKKPFVVVHTSLVELLSRKELQAVLAHELGHLKCDHGVWLTFANILTLGAYSVPGLGGFIAQQLEEQLLRWLRAAELTCDRAALLVARDPKVVISVLMKLAGGCPSMADQLNVDAFLEQARSYEKASSSPVGWYISNAQTRQLSHPLPVLRAREIDEWSRSKEYQSLLKRVKWVNSVQNV